MCWVFFYNLFTNFFFSFVPPQGIAVLSVRGDGSPHPSPSFTRWEGEVVERAKKRMSWLQETEQHCLFIAILDFKIRFGKQKETEGVGTIL